MFYPRRQREMKALPSIQVYIQQWFHDEQGAILLWPEIWTCTRLLVGDFTFDSKLQNFIH